MPTIINHNTLVRRALTFIDERRREQPGCPLAALLDEAGERFNLSPADGVALEHLLHEIGVAPAAAGKDA